MPGRVNVRGLRESMGLSHDDIADRLGVHPRTVWRWESGETKPSPLALRQLRDMVRPNDRPRRRDYEPHTNGEPAPSASGTIEVPAPMSGGVIPSRRVP